MFLIYDWLSQSKSVGQYFLRFGLVILCSIIFISSMLGISYTMNEIIRSSNKSYILISMTEFNSMITIGLMISIIIAIYCYIDSIRYFKKFRFGKTIENYCSLGFAIVLIIIISSLVYFCNNYYVFYNDKIEKHNILGKTMYSYKDIKFTDIGYKKIRYDEYLYYNVNFKNGESVNIANGLVLEPNEKNLILKLDKIINQNK